MRRAEHPRSADDLLAVDRLRERFPRVAVVHDWLTIPGGSEQVVLELLEMFPHAELFTSVYDPAPWPAQITERPVHASFLNRIPGAVRHYPRLLAADEQGVPVVRSFAASISCSPAATRARRTFARPRALCTSATATPRCATPGRRASCRARKWGASHGWLCPPLLRWLRRQDLEGSRGPDVFVANSGHVAARINRYYGRSSEIVHPPVDVDHYLGVPRAPAEFYLVFGRVVPYKRVDIAVAGMPG